MEERHSIDQDLPLHWYRYFDDDGGEVRPSQLNLSFVYTGNR